ncbi:MAG: ABC transporter permease subunit [Lachnospiraceae bacterium]
MNKLLSAEFIRLAKSLVYRLGLLVSGGMGALFILVRWSDMKMHPELFGEGGLETTHADGLLFVGALYMIFVIAVVVGIFVGTEYSDGTIRNKLTAGHTRSSIYLSKLIVSSVAAVSIQLLYVLTVWGLGTLLIGGTSTPVKTILLLELTSMAVTVALTAILLLFAMLIQSKAVGSVACLLAVIIMLFATLIIWQGLNAPEYFEGYSYVDTETGEVVQEEKIKNNNYLTGTKREIYEFLNEFLPVSQLYQIAMECTERLGYMVLYDGLIVLVSTGAGIIAFRKKNLK